MNDEEIQARAELIAEFYNFVLQAKERGLSKEDCLREVEDAFASEEKP